MAQGYPVPKFFFSVSKPDDEFSNQAEIGFTEVSGLDYQIDPIEYRHGDDPNFSKIKMAGLRKFSNVTLKKAIIQGKKESNHDFYKWLGDGGNATSVRKRLDYRKTVTITLKDEESNPVAAWTLTNAFPVKVAFTDMKADANEIAIDTLELAIEDLSVEFL
jgi:phage tail-like protein